MQTSKQTFFNLKHLYWLTSGRAGVRACKAIAPVLEVLATEYEGKVKIVKVDVTACEQTAVNYNIRNIPALLMFKNGEVVAQQIGAAPKSKLTAFIDENI